MARVAMLLGRAHIESDEDDGFREEARAAEDLEIETHTLDLDLVVDGEAELAVEELPRKRVYVYRGAILTEDEYASLEEAVADRGARLLVDARAYARATYVPEWYEALEARTPRTVWIEGTDAGELWELATRELPPPPWIVKDHVKSAKEQWLRACFVPAGADREAFAQTCAALVEARGERFERGLVAREHVALRELGYRTPERAVCDEHRLFFVDGELVAQAPYHDIDDVEPLDPRELRFLRGVIESPFYCVDVARTADGGLTVIEVNDGGIATLPAAMDPRELFEALTERS